MTTFLFVRHSITNGDSDDSGLTLPGRELAREAGDRLVRHNATYVYSSPLRRAYETAEEIALRLGLEIMIDDRLRERTIPGTERTPKPLAAFVEDISTRWPRATVIVVAHATDVGAFLGGHEDWPPCGVTELKV